MRTTLTLDDDVAARLKDMVHDLRMPFKEVVNDVLRRGLDGGGDDAPNKRFVVRPFYGTTLQPGIDPDGFNKLVDDLETEAFLEKMAKQR